MNLEKVLFYLDRRITVNKSSDCVEWCGPKTKLGYGSFHTSGIKTTAHRAVYWIFNGGSIGNMEVHHKCNNILCVNIDHLEPLSVKEHREISGSALQTHCIHGHEFSESNTYYKVSNGTRVCRKCAAIRQQSLRKIQNGKS